MSKSRHEKAAKIRQIMDTEGEAVHENTTGFNDGRYESVAKLEDYEGLKDEARAIKEDAIARLPDLIDQLTETVEANGGTVYIADDAEDANQYINQIADEKEADRLVKSKSMTSEEIEVNEALEEEDVEVIETDLGEWVLQVADEAPSHIVAPAIHKKREEIADLFNEYFDTEEELETAEDLTMFARERLGDLIEDADIGMTGANFITADTGTVALVTSEGNARKSALVPDTHVAVAGVEKILPTVEDLQPFIELIGRSGTGQDVTSYISLLTPPTEAPVVHFDDPDTPLAEDDTDREFHLVLIDNGRMAMREDDQLRETLYCIRCSACSNTCANFQEVGGHVFGGETYTGGIATGWEAGVEGLDTAAEFNDLCSSCSRCADACPVRIDIPWINEVVRDRVNHQQEGELDWLVEGLVPDEEPGGLDIQKRFFGNFETAAKLGSTFAPLSNWVADLSISRRLMEEYVGVDRRRKLPTFQRETLQEWFEEHHDTRTSHEREVVLYNDLYTNHMTPERGKAAVRALEALGCRVIMPDVGSSGREPLSQGMISTAEEHAHDVYGTLAEHIDAGRDIVVIEPSDLAMFHRDYEHFLPEQSFERIKSSSYDVMEYIFGLLENGADADALAGPADAQTARVAYHSNCQQRTIHKEQYTEAVLDRLGFDVVQSDVECCGMAGSFGYKEQYYELSMEVGDNLQEQFTTDETRDRMVVGSGTSCEKQLDSLFDRPSNHAVELIDPKQN
jgi:iron-sulfur cluster protein